MASQVLSGSGNLTYTNNTGQNVRVVINFMSTVSSMSWAGVTHTSSISGSTAPTIGRNLAFNVGTGGNTGISANNMIVPSGGYETLEFSYPTELMLSTGQTFSAVLAGVYNIVVIPEAG